MDGVSIERIARLSVSLAAILLARLDAMVDERGLPSRSQMIAELIRHEQLDGNRELRTINEREHNRETPIIEEALPGSALP